MRIADYVITAAVVAGLSGTAMAQTPATAPVVPATPTYNSSSDNHWIASAFVGTNFSTGGTSDLNNLVAEINNNDTSINFGGQAAYLWGGIGGVEGLMDFSPSFGLNNLLFQDNPAINTYMINGIVGAPVGSDGSFLPYVSGGFGGVQLRSTIFTTSLTPAAAASPVVSLDTVSANGTRFGGDIGGGVLGFSGNWGFRGDLRYYKTSVDNNVNLTNSLESIFAQEVLSGLSFWKANVGIAFRW